MDGGWDHHGNIPVILKQKMEEADKPIAALLRDLKDRGMLDDTLVIFCGEFGRTSYCEGPLSFANYGRDHQQLCGGLLLVGGGFRGGFAYGETDDWGWDVVKTRSTSTTSRRPCSTRSASTTCKLVDPLPGPRLPPDGRRRKRRKPRSWNSWTNLSAINSRQQRSARADEIDRS